ncbi:MAG: membrane protein insertase YidC [Gemmatimonadetes bacterium]|nr:membrane protein insertase YidC [Gemmatimonadota bacterium]
MRTELRLLVAIALMVGVMVITNVMFPPVPPPELPADSVAVGDTLADTQGALPRLPGGDSVEMGSVPDAAGAPDAVVAPARDVVVETPLARLVFTTRGARLTSAELKRFASFAQEGPVQLVPENGLLPLGRRLVVGNDTLDLRTAPFEVSAPGLDVAEGDDTETLAFTWTHPSGAARMVVEYAFHPEAYRIDVSGRVEGLDGALLLTDLGSGIPYNEARQRDDDAALAFVTRHDRDGIDSERLSGVRQGAILPGPFTWVAFKSKYFVSAMVAGAEGNQDAAAHFGGVIVRPTALENQAEITVAQGLGADGTFQRRLFVGPQELARLSSLGEDLEEVNPYGWRFFRPIVRPFTAIINWILLYLHNSLNIGYGWVLIIFGVAMRIVLWPLNAKAMRAQLRNMAAQPRLQEIQTKYKNNPEKLQQEMMKLYKEEGFNPLAGCLPMLLPWPILIALFFVFQNSIELRGVPFLWLPDLSAPDPLYVLPVFMGVSMLFMQWIGMRNMPPNPQMKIMMWVMPIFLTVLFLQFPAGLNLYYATSNVATIPQQYWISKERAKVQAKQQGKGSKPEPAGKR